MLSEERRGTHVPNPGLLIGSRRVVARAFEPPGPAWRGRAGGGGAGAGAGGGGGGGGPGRPLRYDMGKLVRVRVDKRFEEVNRMWEEGGEEIRRETDANRRELSQLTPSEDFQIRTRECQNEVKKKVRDSKAALHTTT